MNSKENRTLFLFLLIVINVFALIAGVYMGMSQILVNSKYGFITVIFVAAGFANYFLMQYRDCRICDNAEKRINAAEDNASRYKNRMLEIAEERDNLRTELEQYTSGTVQEEYDNLRKKCDTIEAFRNSFPYKVADGYVLYNIIRTGMLVGNASSWQIIGDYHGELWKTSVVRPYSQSYKDMLTLVAATQTPEEIEELNQSDTLLWE